MASEAIFLAHRAIGRTELRGSHLAGAPAQRQQGARHCLGLHGAPVAFTRAGATASRLSNWSNEPCGRRWR